MTRTYMCMIADKNKSSSSLGPQLTESGLKVVDWSGQGLTTIPSNLLTG